MSGRHSRGAQLDAAGEAAFLTEVPHYTLMTSHKLFILQNIVKMSSEREKPLPDEVKTKSLVKSVSLDNHQNLTGIE